MKKVLVVVLVLLSVLAFSKTTITFWHAMSGSNLTAVDNIVKGFNEARTRSKELLNSPGVTPKLSPKR